MPDAADSIRRESVDDEALFQCCFCAAQLRDPMLLPCLHNCCRRCACHDNNSDRNQANGESESKIVCPSCGNECEIAELYRNSLVASKIAVSSVLHHSQGCDVCRERPELGMVEPDLWCSRCGFVCSNCAGEHQKAACCTGANATCIPLDDPRGLDSLLEQLLGQCAEHAGNRLEYFCLACERPKCKDCFATCLSAEHELEDIGRSQANRSSNLVERHIKRLRQIFLSKSSVLQQHVALQEDLRQARVEHLDRLRAAKKSIVDAAEAACRECESAVNTIYDVLDACTYDLSERARRLDRAVQQAVSYSSHLVQADDVAVLLDQQSIVLSRLRALIKEVKVMREVRSPSELITHDMPLPGELTLSELTKSWFGTPKLTTDNVMCTKSDMQVLRECIDLEDSPQQDRTFPVKCLDLAVTDVGNCIVAAGNLGLIEYSRSGDRLTCWSPDNSVRPDGAIDVLAVDILPGNCVVVGLSSAPFVTILQRDAALACSAVGWTEKRRIVGLGAPCWHLSACGTLIGVAEGRWDVGFRRLRPAPRATLLQESCDAGPFLQLQLDYDAFCVAVTQDSIITASSGLAKLQARNGENGRYLLDAYTHRGDLLWRRSVREPVWDVIASATGSVLYVILADSAVVTAVNCRNGNRLKDLALVDRGVAAERPITAARAFLFRGYELFVLYSDSTTVRTYSSLQ